MKTQVLLSKLNPENIEFKLSKSKNDTDPKNTSKFFNMLYKTEDGKTIPINIQLPKLVAPFGLSGFTSDKGDTNYSISLELLENTKAYKNLYRIQEKALQFVIDNADFFYKNKKDRTNVAAYGKEFIKESSSDYPSTFNIKMKLDKNNPENFEAKADIITTVENEEPLVEENQILNIDTGLNYITKRCEVQAVINPYGYQVDTKYGLTLRAVKLRVFTNGAENDNFLSENESEEESQESQEFEVDAED